LARIGKGFLLQVFKFAVALGLIAFLIAKGHLNLRVLGALLRPEYSLPLLGLVGLNLLILNYRWQLLLKERSLPGSFRRTFPNYLIGVFFNYALPGSIGGDVIKAIYVAQDNPSRKADAVATVLVDRIIGLYGMVLMTLGVILWKISFVRANPQLVAVSFMVLGLFGAMTFFLGLTFSRRLRAWIGFDLWLEKIPLGGKIRAAYVAIHAYRDHMSLLGRSLVIGVIGQAVTVFFMILVGFAMGEQKLGWDTYFFAVPMGFIVSAVPLAPAGIGVGQMAFLFLFQVYSGQKTMIGQTAITAFQIALFAWGLIGAYFYLQRKAPAPGEVIP
jgi:uncharacterized protein (TIRG00374 family)